jgi:hypothetical protein
MGEAIKEAYQDIFLINANPTSSDQTAIVGKFKSFHNASDNFAQLMSKTLFGLLALADISTLTSKKTVTNEKVPAVTNGNGSNTLGSGTNPASFSEFHYNIQIHLPATKDVEVYNSIFKSLKDHSVD